MNLSINSLHIHDLPTDQFEERPPETAIDTLIIHSMHNLKSEDRFSAASCKECLDQDGVSAHYIIDLDGQIWRTVAEENKAWHAGVSKMPNPEDGREAVNAFSIGVEVIGTDDTDFTEAQYEALAYLTKDIMSRHRIRNIYGHANIAPERKTDPWGFDWPRYRRDIADLTSVDNINFPPAAFEA
jgi:AmpD protein